MEALVGPRRSPELRRRKRARRLDFRNRTRYACGPERVCTAGNLRCRRGWPPDLVALLAEAPGAHRSSLLPAYPHRYLGRIPIAPIAPSGSFQQFHHSIENFVRHDLLTHGRDLVGPAGFVNDCRLIHIAIEGRIRTTC